MAEGGGHQRDSRVASVEDRGSARVPCSPILSESSRAYSTGQTATVRQSAVDLPPKLGSPVLLFPRLFASTTRLEFRDRSCSRESSSSSYSSSSTSRREPRVSIHGPGKRQPETLLIVLAMNCQQLYIERLFRVNWRVLKILREFLSAKGFWICLIFETACSFKFLNGKDLRMEGILYFHNQVLIFFNYRTVCMESELYIHFCNFFFCKRMRL